MHHIFVSILRELKTILLSRTKQESTLEANNIYSSIALMRQSALHEASSGSKKAYAAISSISLV